MIDLVHTATLTYTPSRSLYKAFKELNTTRYYQQEKAYVNESLKQHGIVITLKEIRAQSYSKPVLSIRINFKRIITQVNRVELCTEQDRDIVAAKFDELLAGFNINMPTFFAWKVNRIDYCINIKTPYVKEYVALLRKGDKPFNVSLTYNEQRNYTQSRGSLYLKGKSITINFYDKEDQLRKQQQHDATITDEIVTQAKDILRLEVQCHKPRTEYLKVKYGMTAKNVHFFLDQQISYDVIERSLLTVAKKGNYVRKRKAISVIEQSNCRTNLKVRLVDLIKEINSQHQSIWKVREKCLSDKKMSKDTFSRCIRKLDELNINAVTISDNKHLEGKSLNDGLVSIHDLFFDAFNENCYIDEIEEESIDSVIKDVSQLYTT